MANAQFTKLQLLGLVEKDKTWLDMEDLVAMMPLHHSLPTDRMNQLVNDFNDKKISMSDVKMAIKKEAKKIDVKDFLRK